jgi:hypothetical protein
MKDEEKPKKKSLLERFMAKLRRHTETVLGIPQDKPGPDNTPQAQRR